jgi:molybdopterin-guanine dinucleotide biosynthesis protein A
MPDVSKDSDAVNSAAAFTDVTGVILAGGRSSRYGKNKALEKVDGIPLIERVVATMQVIFRHLFLITNTPHEYAYLQIPMHGDLIKGLGPMGGVYTGLKVISEDAGFFVGCDMPCLSEKLIRHMVEIRNHFDVVVPRVNGKMEALHALYGRRCAAAISHKIDQGEYQIIRFFPELLVRYVDEDEIRRFDPHLKSFLNVNRPDELRRFMSP